MSHHAASDHSRPRNLRRLERLDVAIIEDKQPIKGFVRFYLRDPGGNRLEIAMVVAE